MKYCDKTSWNDGDIELKERDGGIYAFGDGKETSVRKHQLIKIGKSTRICNRTYQYHSCFPDGVQFYALLLVKQQPREKLDEYSERLKGIESEIHKSLQKYRHKTTTRIQATIEWFDVGHGTLLRKFKDYYIKNKDNHELQYVGFEID